VSTIFTLCALEAFVDRWCTDVFAAETFLVAALSVDVTSLLLQQPDAWAYSAQGVVFLVSSAHALAGLKILHVKSSAAMKAKRPAIGKLALRLTELLLHDLLTSLPDPGASYNLFDLKTREFPWHGAMESFVEYFPSEMGAILRFLARARQQALLRNSERLAAAALFPLDSSADDNLRMTITRHLARRNNSVRESTPEVISPTLEIGSGVSHYARSALHEYGDVGPGQMAAGLGESLFTREVSSSRYATGSPEGSHAETYVLDWSCQPSPHHVVDVLPADECDSVSVTVPVADSSRPSVSGFAELDRGQALPRTDDTGIGQLRSNVPINLQPSLERVEPRNMLAVNLPGSGIDFEGHRGPSSEQGGVRLSASNSERQMPGSNDGGVHDEKWIDTERASI
jgi:hypothetical protein